MSEKKLLRAVRLCVSAAIQQQSVRAIDERHVQDLAEAKSTLEQVRGDELIATLAMLAKGGLPMEIDLSPSVRFTDEKSPGWSAGRF